MTQVVPNCDQCGAIAQVDAQWVVWVKSKLTLYFCGHHYRRHLAVFKSRGYQSQLLADTPEEIK